MFGWFKKRKAPAPPVIEVDGLRVELCSETWSFTFAGLEFVSYEADFKCPSRARIEAMVAEIDQLRPAMIEVVKDELEEWSDNIPPADHPDLLVDLTDFAAEGKYEVEWSGFEGWGDLQINVIIKDGQIVDHWAGD